MQILIVEDEKKIAHFLKRGLMEETYVVDIAYDGKEALYKCDINVYDLIILDVMLPEISGLEVCKKIREKNTNVLVLMLTAKSTVEDKIAGLDAGADDYITKPFSFAELLARIRALLRRDKIAKPVILTIDNVMLNPATKIVKRGKKEIQLTAREYALLEYFMHHPNMVISKTQLLEHVWDYNYEGLSNIVETYIKYLRKKLQQNAKDKELIHTLRGLGYILKVQ